MGECCERWHGFGPAFLPFHLATTWYLCSHYSFTTASAFKRREESGLLNADFPHFAKEQNLLSVWLPKVTVPSTKVRWMESRLHHPKRWFIRTPISKSSWGANAIYSETTVFAVIWAAQQKPGHKGSHNLGNNHFVISCMTPMQPLL